MDRVPGEYLANLVRHKCPSLIVITRKPINHLCELLDGETGEAVAAFENNKAAYEYVLNTPPSRLTKPQSLGLSSFDEIRRNRLELLRKNLNAIYAETGEWMKPEESVTFNCARTAMRIEKIEIVKHT